MEAQLTHVRLLVEDFRSCFGFYKNVVGLEVAWGDESTGYAEFAAGDVRLALFERKEMAEVVGTTPLTAEASATDSVAVVFRVSDVDQVCEELRSSGVEFLTEPQDRVEWQIRTAHFRDPDGNLLEINQRLL
jgi:catechol 2,3-dioxygenase-like lactoylglutathione lyase family enzyme